MLSASSWAHWLSPPCPFTLHPMTSTQPPTPGRGSTQLLGSQETGAFLCHSNTQMCLPSAGGHVMETGVQAAVGARGLSARQKQRPPSSLPDWHPPSRNVLSFLGETTLPQFVAHVDPNRATSTPGPAPRVSSEQAWPTVALIDLAQLSRS